MEYFINSLVFTAIVLAVILLFKQNMRQKLDARTWISALMGIGMTALGLAWANTSFYEGEPQAAWVGIFTFCGFGVIMAILALRNMFPEKLNFKAFAISPDKIGMKVAAAVLLFLGIILLPLSNMAGKFAGYLTDKEQMEEFIFDNILSDEALPAFVKKTLAYQKRYGEHPGSLKPRLMQGMVAGIKDEGMIEFTDMILPENERLQVFQMGTGAIETWLISEDAYPKLTIVPAIYLDRVDKNAEQIVCWMYNNLGMPPMKDTTVVKFRAGVFSTNLEDYMGTPPDDIKASLITPLAGLIRKQLTTVDVPEKVSLSEAIKEKATIEELTENKAKLRKVTGILSKLWLLPALLLIGGVVLVVVGKLNWSKWLAWSVLALGIRMIPCVALFGDAQHFVQELIPELTEKAPAPALALMNFVLPQLIQPIANLFSLWMNIALMTGVVGLLILYWDKIITIVKSLTNTIKRPATAEV
ncbi:MAG: hypothetical protein MI866_03590 [Bacteroidales bacterium]|nr:hypothetical protein [Bacteroidales bacterium]